MEVSDNSAHPHHRQTRRSKRQNKHRKHHVAHVSRALPSDHWSYLTSWPTRDAHARDDDKENLVHTWLEDIETPRLQFNSGTLSKESNSKAPSRSKPARRSPRLWSPNEARSQTSHDREASHGCSQREQKVPRNLVQDKSDLGLGGEHDPIRVAAEMSRVLRPASVATESCHESGKKRPQQDSGGSVASVISSGTHYHFAKKPRHRTRSDRYDTAKVHEPRKARGRKKKSGDKSKGTAIRRASGFSSAREVMEKFDSGSILSDRITMQPLLKPGLFDNGRASKKQLPDLTFHEMQFLKRPRPPKPVPRDREGAKRRGEKQLEEVSAFFLQKSLPEGFGASGRKKPVVSCPSSLDGATADSSASNLEAPLHHFNLSQKNEHQPSDQVRDMSRGTTHYTWSSSYAPLDPGTARMSEVEVQKSVQSSTPPRIRDTLEKTAMSCSDRRPKLMNGIMSRSKDVSDEKPQAVFADSVKVRPNTPRQEVRIVRYHDRGMMASEEAEATAERRTRPTETPRDAMQYPTQTPARFEASAGCAKSSEVSPEDEAFSRPYEAEDTQTAKGFHAADHGTRPKRPKSPKWTLVEQLEAAVENVESQKSQSGLPRASSSLAVQEGVHLAPSHYKTSVPGNYNVSQQGHLEFNPALFGDRQLDLFEAGQEHSHLVTVTDLPQGGQQAYKVSLAPKVALKPTCEESSQVHKAGWPSSDARTLSSAYREPSKVSPMDRSALENHYTVQTIPSDSDNNPNMVPLLNNFGAGGYGQPVRNHVSSKEQFMSPGDTDLLQQRSSRRQSLEEYIAQMEYEVLSRPQQDDVESASPTSRWCELPEGSAAHLEDTPRAPHSYVGLHGQGLWQDGHFNDRSISGVYHGGRDVINDPESDQEEQRFMSTFWRPNRC